MQGGGEMAKQLNDEQVYKEAKRRVEAKKGFWKHLIAYVVVNIILIIVYVLGDWGNEPWFLYVLGIWGIIVISHYVRVFVLQRKSDTEAIEKEAEKIRIDQS